MPLSTTIETVLSTHSAGRLTQRWARGRIGPREAAMRDPAGERGLTIEKLTPHIGAEVHGVDLSVPLDEPTFKQVHDALIDNQVIFFRHQHLPPAPQKASARLLRAPPAP